jgi:hypothetical protein
MRMVDRKHLTLPYHGMNARSILGVVFMLYSSCLKASKERTNSSLEALPRLAQLSYLTFQDPWDFQKSQCSGKGSPSALREHAQISVRLSD